MSGVKHTPWEVGQHPAISNGWIVRPVLFGSNIRVLPESEGGHVIIRDERVARLIAAAPDLLEALEAHQGVSQLLAELEFCLDEERGEIERQLRDIEEQARAAIARARGEQGGGGE